MYRDDLILFYNNLNSMSLRRDWAGLEQYFQQNVEQFSGSDQMSIVQAVSLDDYISRLHAFLYEQCLRLSHHAVRALYFEYNPNQLWDSRLYICDRYTRASVGNEEWCKHWIDSAAGPDMPEFARLYQQSGNIELGTLPAASTAFYLFARTTAAFGLAVSTIETHKFAVCLGHHGQEKITRIYE
jgi:hypothetical protein